MKEGRKEGREEGRREGRNEGRREGMKEGRNEEEGTCSFDDAIIYNNYSYSNNNSRLNKAASETATEMIMILKHRILITVGAV